VASGELSFAEFVHARNQRLLDLAWLVTRSTEDARDAVQEALTGLYRNWERLPAGDEFEAYVHRTVVNACLRVIRRRPRWLPVPAPGELRSAPSTTDAAEAVATSDELWRLCGELTAVQRAAVVLRFWSDCTYAEIGSALGCTEATARSHVHRATARLRTRMAAGEQ